MKFSTMRAAPLLAALMTLLLASISAQTPGKCFTSDRGYQCMLQVCSSIAFHWSINGPPPGVNCRYATTNSSTNGTATAVSALNGNLAGGVMHIALVSSRAGYVAMGWPTRGGRMVPADAIAGWVSAGSGTASVQGFYLGGKTVGQCPASNGIPLTNTAAQTTGNNVVACFTRPLNAVGQAGVQLSLTSPQALNFVGGGQRAWSEHTVDCSVSVSLNAYTAAGNPTTGGNGGQDYGEGGSGDDTVSTHGWLMIVAWTLLAPIGMAIPRFRDVVNEAPFAKWLPQKPQPWFIVHLLCQWSAVVLFVASMAIIIAQNHLEVDEWVGLGKAHGSIGLTVLGLLVLHLLVAFIRPAPGGRFRKQWEFVHHWAGRCTTALAIVNTLIGPVYMNQLLQEDMTGMYVVAAIFLMLGLVVTVLLMALSYKRQVDKLSYPQNTSASATSVALTAGVPPASG